jgi:NDP-sugar pyrophosphorylase family protein
VDFTIVEIAIISHKPLQVLADEKKLNDAIAKALQGKHKNDQKSTEIIRDFLEKNGKELGLPPSEANEAVILLYDAVFTDIDSGRDASIEEDDFRKLVREILEKFAEQLQANPVYCDLDG